MQFVARSLSSYGVLQTLFICLFAGICSYLLFLNNHISLHFPTHRFSLKAPYRFPLIQRLPPSPLCELLHLLTVSRHTSRYPTAKHIERFSALQSKLSNISFIPQFEWLGNWTNSFSLERAGELSPAGEREARQIGENFRRRYAPLFDHYSPLLFQVNSTVKNRAYATAQAFLTGAFGAKWREEFRITRNSENDPFLRFFDNCLRYHQNKLENASREVERMENSSEFIELVERINNRIGTNLFNFSDINTLWDICSMEYLATGSSSVCELFSDRDAQVMEFLYDRRAFLLKSNGYPINVRMSCVLLKYIVSQLERAIGGGGVRANLYFAHAETLIPLLALLNITTDSVFMENVPSAPDRDYVFGLLVPMGANLAFTLFRCGPEEVWLSMALNGELVLFGQDSKGSILVSDFFEITHSLIARCDPDSLCSI